MPEVLDARGLLFGPEVEVSLDFLKNAEDSQQRSLLER